MNVPAQNLTRRLSIAAAFLLAGLTAAAPALAEESGVVSKWEIVVGSIFADVDTDIEASNDRAEAGTRIDLEDIFGYDDTENLFRFTVARRVARRHIVALDIQELSRSGARTLEFEVRFRDTVFPANVEVESDFDMRVIDLRYSYLAVSKEKTAVTVSAGLGQWDYDLEVRAREQGTGLSLSSEVDVDELVPLLGAKVRHRINPKLDFDARLIGLYFDLDDTSGTILDLDLGFSYWFHRNVGVAGSFYYLNAAVEFNDPRRLLADIDYALTGFQLYIPIRFD